jgi:excisionase family DNA binding protein
MSDLRPPALLTNRVNLSVREFCTLYGIGRTLFYEEVGRGHIRLVKVGRRTLIPVAEAERWQVSKLFQEGR